jgi:hypothetical protein
MPEKNRGRVEAATLELFRILDESETPRVRVGVFGGELTAVGNACRIQQTTNHGISSVLRNVLEEAAELCAIVNAFAWAPNPD